MRRSEADRRGLKPLAAIAAHSTYANTPALFPTAPIGAIRGLLDRTRSGYRMGHGRILDSMFLDGLGDA